MPVSMAEPVHYIEQPGGGSRPVNLVLRVNEECFIDGPAGYFEGYALSPPELAGRTHRVIVPLKGMREFSASDHMPIGASDHGALEAHPAVRRDQHGLMAPGLMVLFHECVPGHSPDDIPTWHSRLAESMDFESKRGVVHGLCRVVVDKEVPRANIDILQVDLARRIDTLANLHEFYEQFLDEHVNGVENNANCVLRIVSPHSDQVVTMWTYVARETVRLSPSRKFTLPASMRKTWDEAIVQGTQAKGLIRMVAAALGANVTQPPEKQQLTDDLRRDMAMGRVFVEAIPGQRVRILWDTLDQVMRPGTRLARTAAQCQMKKSSGEPIVGFVPMTVSLILRPPEQNGVQKYKTQVAGKFIPDPNERARTVEMVRTANFTPRQKS